MMDYMSSFPKEDILIKEIESWKSFVVSMSSIEDRGLFENMLNDCYKYAATINAKGEPFPAEPLIMALMLSQHIKLIDWLTKRISKYQSLNNKEIERFKEEEQELGRENAHDYIRKNDGRIHYIDD